MSLTASSVRVRFAPSPTGHLHIGGVRTAIYNWLFARHTTGTYLLRVEDTDTQRSTPEYLESQLKSLRWLNLLPDEPLVYQMSRVDEHAKAAQKLVEKGQAYRCFCQPRDVDQVLELHEQGVASQYPGTCRDRASNQDDSIQPHAIRFKVPLSSHDIVFNDIIRGPISVKSENIDDFVIFRRDGTPTYNFCVVVDDIFMNITHVIRGEDHISNTFKQVLLYQALGSSIPVFAHLPLILGKSGAKLSKRDAVVSVEAYREQGFIADALFNYLVRLGWSHGDQEVFTREELITLFKLEEVGKKGAIFDIQKLEWLNSVYIRQMSYEKIIECISYMDESLPKKLLACWSAEQLEKLIDLYRQRVTTLRQLTDALLALSVDPISLDLSLITKWRTANTKQLVLDFGSFCTNASFQNHTSLLEQAKLIGESHKEQLVNLAQALRLALTGSVNSPGVFELLCVLGRERSCHRINRLIERL